MAQARTVAKSIAIGLLVLLFLLQGILKLSGAAHEVAAFTERWGYPLWFMYLVGALEVAGAIGLLLPALRPVAALGLVALMLGAIATHVRLGEWAMLGLPVATLALAGWVAWEERVHLRVPRAHRMP